MILAGDIGGTKTVLALYETDALDAPVREKTFPSQKHATFDEIVRTFLSAGPACTLSAGCFGVAGPIVSGRCKTTNLPWSLDEGDLAKMIGAPRVKLLNDLEAAAFGMLFLKPEELCILNPGKADSKGNVAVVAAGTGLGEAILYWDGKDHHPIASEGGHTDFAPRNDLEIELLRYLMKVHGGHASYERILSGPGFVSVYEFLRDTGRYPEDPKVRAEYEASEKGPVLGKYGLERTDPLATAAMDMFCEIYGSEAGNLALKCLSLGGVYVGGGIGPKILAALQRGGFMEAFKDKGRFAKLLGDMPVKVALNPRAPIIGAAQYAKRISR